MLMLQAEDHKHPIIVKVATSLICHQLILFHLWSLNSPIHVSLVLKDTSVLQTFRFSFHAS